MTALVRDLRFPDTKLSSMSTKWFSRCPNLSFIFIPIVFSCILFPFYLYLSLTLRGISWTSYSSTLSSASLMFSSCYRPPVKITLWLSFPHIFFSVCMSEAALSHAGPESNEGKNHQYETGRLPDWQHNRVTPLSMHEPSHSVCSNFPFILVLNRLSNHSFRGL